MVSASRKNRILFFAGAAVVLALDQFSKIAARSALQPGESLSLLGPLKITLIKNYGAAFGLLQNFTVTIIIISLAALGIVFYNYKKITGNATLSVIAGILLGGVLGNLIDRVFFGFVTDFIDFGFWPAFNVADSALTIGIALLIFLTWKKTA